MQDELFARNVNCVLIIKEGFKLDVVTIPGTQAATTFESVSYTHLDVYKRQAVMAKSAYTLYPNDAAEPSATSVSMFGAP